MNPLSEGALRHLRHVIDLPDLSGTKYVIGDKIASGGMGTVYRAEDTSLGRTVAVKVMHSALQTGTLVDRMLREARVVARLEHPGVVPIHDAGVLPDGRPYYVMKYVSGKRLDQVAAAPGTERRELLRLFQKICDAIGFAHDRGVIHRDIKPANIMVGAFGEVLVMDWGVAKLSGSGGSPDQGPPRTKAGGGVGAEETKAGTVLGTPGYMSPEQASGDTSLHTVRSDIYALGAVLFYILSGTPPPEGGSADARDRLKGIPRPLREICLKAMSFAPSGRYQTAQDLSADVSLYLDAQAVSAYRESLFERSSRWVSKNAFLFWLILAYLLMRAIVVFLSSR